MNLYFGALAFFLYYGATIMGTNLVRFSLMKHLPAGTAVQRQLQQLDGYHTLESNPSQQPSARFSVEFEEVRRPNTVFSSSIVRQQQSRAQNGR